MEPLLGPSHLRRSLLRCGPRSLKFGQFLVESKPSLRCLRKRKLDKMLTLHAVNDNATARTGCPAICIIWTRIELECDDSKQAAGINYKICVHQTSTHEVVVNRALNAPCTIHISGMQPSMSTSRLRLLIKHF